MSGRLRRLAGRAGHGEPRAALLGFWDAPCRGVVDEAGIEPSVGSVGDSYDNVFAETVIGLYKAEVIRRRGPWRNLEAVEFATLEWIAWFNNHRLPEPIGNIPPVELEEAYYRQQNASAMMAGVN